MGIRIRVPGVEVQATNRDYLDRCRVPAGMDRSDFAEDGHRPTRPDHWSAVPWGAHASREPLDTTADAAADHASMLRRELRRWLDDDVPEAVAEDVTLTAYEAIADIVEHADPLGAGPIRLQARLDPERVDVTVSYTGSWRTAAEAEQPQYGLALIRALTDHASFHREVRHITVHLSTRRSSSPDNATRDGHH